jgi:hypothetical protein
LAAPRRADRTLLPAGLAALLLALFVAQWFLPATSAPPVALPVATTGRIGAPPAAPPSADPGPVLARPLFAPRRPMNPGAGVAASPLGGAVVAGSIAVRGRPMAIVRAPDGAVRRLPIGGMLAGWRLAALDPGGARFRKGGETLTMAYGAAAPPAGASEDDTGDEE